MPIQLGAGNSRRRLLVVCCGPLGIRDIERLSCISVLVARLARSRIFGCDEMPWSEVSIGRLSGVAFTVGSRTVLVPCALRRLRHAFSLRGQQMIRIALTMRGGRSLSWLARLNLPDHGLDAFHNRRQ